MSVKRVWFHQTLENYIDIDIDGFDLSGDDGYEELDDWMLTNADLGNAEIIGVKKIEVDRVEDVPVERSRP